MLGLRFGECVRGCDTVAALGGDSFGVLLAGIDMGVSISGIAGRLTSAISRPYTIDGRPFYITASVGISVAPYDGNEPSALLRVADIAMRAVKNDGGLDFATTRLKCRPRPPTKSSAKMNCAERWNTMSSTVFSAAGRHYRKSRRRRGVAHTVEPSGARHGAAARIHRTCRPDRPDRPAGRVGLAQRLSCGWSWSRDELDMRVCVNVSAVQFRTNLVEFVGVLLEELELAPNRLNSS